MPLRRSAAVLVLPRISSWLCAVDGGALGFSRPIAAGRGSLSGNGGGGGDWRELADGPGWETNASERRRWRWYDGGESSLSSGEGERGGGAGRFPHGRNW